jgi:hypothetical protein
MDLQAKGQTRTDAFVRGTLYQAATQQYRKLQSVLKRMEHVSQNAVLRLALSSFKKKST